VFEKSNSQSTHYQSLTGAPNLTQTFKDSEISAGADPKTLDLTLEYPLCMILVAETL
jgi:hypothetical protein